MLEASRDGWPHMSSIHMWPCGQSFKTRQKSDGTWSKLCGGRSPFLGGMVIGNDASECCQKGRPGAAPGLSQKKRPGGETESCITLYPLMSDFTLPLRSHLGPFELLIKESRNNYS